MLLRVLGIRADALEVQAITDLVTNVVAEHQLLEYKSQLPGASQDDRREFARDIAAMANGGGGVLVIGIEDDANDAATQATPVALGGEVTRLNQICNSLIEPFVQLDIHEVEVGGGPYGFIVIEVPPSPRAPFAVAEGSRLGYYRRTGKNRHPLTEAEVAELYRSRGVRLEDATARLGALIASVPVRLGDDPPPVVYLAIVPLETYERLFRPDRATLASVLAQGVAPVFGTDGVGDVLLTDLRPGFKRIDLAQGYDERVLRRYGWMEFHDDGAFLGVIPGDNDLRQGLGTSDAEEEEPAPGFYDTRLTCQLVARLAAYGVLARQFDVYGELMMAAGIPGEGLPATITTSPERWHANFTQVVTTPVRTALSADVDELTEMQGVLRVAAPLLDDLMSAFGWPQCFQLDREGTIRLRFWGGEWVQQIRRWTDALELPVTEEQ